MRGSRTCVLALFVAMLLVAPPLSAQGLVIGFKVGPTFSNLDVSDDENEEENRLTSFGGGGFIRFSLGRLSIQPELLALTKGSEVDGPGDDDFKIKIDYVEVPVFLNLSFGTGTVRPYLLIGPSFAFDIGCTAEADFGGSEIEEDCDDAAAGLEFTRSSIDVGGAVGLGLSLAAGPGSLLFEGRYTHGFTDIFDDEGAVNDEIRNRSYALFVGYSIGLGAR